MRFNAIELHIKRLNINTDLGYKFATFLYEKISDYGRSFVRPMLTFFILIVFTYFIALLHAGIYSPKNCTGEVYLIFSDFLDNKKPSCLSIVLKDDKFLLSGYRAAFEYTSFRAAGILDFSDSDKQTAAVAKRLFDAEVEPWWMRFWGIFKALASASLLFLAALGLRNKYRIK